uniref:Uncharacterized protein n=1 Tax=Anguilla anguilla TaxID=7936 RepID=A0A0E9RQJ6_ANGAN
MVCFCSTCRNEYRHFCYWENKYYLVQTVNKNNKVWSEYFCFGLE